MGNKVSRKHSHQESHTHQSQSESTHRKLVPERSPTEKYAFIPDQYETLDEVTAALRESGLESSNLIVGIDFTQSNEWTGRHSFNGRSLHEIGSIMNPYEQAISILGRTLSPFDEDNLIPCYGFGDGPTSFAPIVEASMGIVEASGGQYHVLVVIADGQVTKSSDTKPGQLSPQEQKTINVISAASQYPLSIVLVGVGDGPWDMMQEFDDKLPRREFDNFQFVNFTSIMSKSLPHSAKEAAFAIAALMEIPSQYRATIELNMLGRHVGSAPNIVPQNPPFPIIQHDAAQSSFPDSTTSQPTASHNISSTATGNSPVGMSSESQSQPLQ